MTRYELLFVLHLIVVIAWLGAGLTMDLLFLRAERTRNPAELGKMGELQQWLVPRLFIPTGLLTLVSGALLVWDGPWSFSNLWVEIGWISWIAFFGVGFLFIRPQGEQMKDIVARHGPGSVEAQRHGRRLGVVSRVQLLALFLVVADMVLKPTIDDPWTLVALAAILVAGAVLGALSLRKVEEANVAADSG